MEDTLRLQLLLLGRLFEGATGVSLASIGKKALNDNTVFARLGDRSVTFQVRTYDRLTIWMSDQWPSGMPWPENILRPSRAAPHAF